MRISVACLRSRLLTGAGPARPGMAGTSCCRELAVRLGVTVTTTGKNSGVSSEYAFVLIGVTAVISEWVSWAERPSSHPPCAGDPCVFRASPEATELLVAMSSGPFVRACSQHGN